MGSESKAQYKVEARFGVEGRWAPSQFLFEFEFVPVQCDVQFKWRVNTYIKILYKNVLLIPSHICPKWHVITVTILHTYIHMYITIYMYSIIINLFNQIHEILKKLIYYLNLKLVLNKQNSEMEQRGARTRSENLGSTN